MTDVPGPLPTFRRELFADLVVSLPPPRRSGVGITVSAAVHVLIAASVVLVPIFWPTPPPEHPDYFKALIYNPPPPPPPPLPKGSAMVEKPQPARPVTPDPKPDVLTAPKDPSEAPFKPEPRDRESEQVGSPTGDDAGLDVGMEGGVVGGVPGGVLGGVLGGEIGGTGDSPVLDYDQPPRLVKQTRPAYPQEAFVKKIEGLVVVEILIDASGRVVRARILQSIPMLDAAALQTVRQWVFTPAIKHGRPVATVANAPVSFRIY